MCKSVVVYEVYLSSLNALLECYGFKSSGFVKRNYVFEVLLFMYNIIKANYLLQSYKK